MFLRKNDDEVPNILFKLEFTGMNKKVNNGVTNISTVRSSLELNTM